MTDPKAAARTERVTIENKIKEMRALQLPAMVKRAEQELTRAKEALKRAAVEAVRERISEKELEEAEATVDDLQHTYDAAVERKRVTQEALALEEAALENCLLTHWDVFATDAMRHTRNAEEAVQKANKLVAAIHGHHAKAVQAWQPLVRAARLNNGVPALSLPPVPTGALRPPGVDESGRIIVGEDQYGRKLGDQRQEHRNEITPERLAELRADMTAIDGHPLSPLVSEEERDAARAMSQQDLDRLAQDTEQQRLANIQATNAERETEQVS